MSNNIIKNNGEIIMNKKGHLNWFFWFLICIFLAVITNEIIGSGSVFQTFSAAVIKLNIPFIHNITAVGIGCFILLIAYLIAIFAAGIINDIFNEGKTIAGFFYHDKSEILKNITENTGKHLKI